MRLITLGNSAASPNPGQGCSSYLVTSGGAQLLLDCGPNTVLRLREYTQLGAVRAIIVSHLHSDHTLDLVTYRYGLKYGPDAGGSGIPLWLPPGGRAFLNQLGDVFALGSESDDPFFDDVFDVHQYDPDALMRIEPYTIHFHPTRHFVPCWAMRITAGGATLVYLADTGPDPSLVNFARGADVLICEATLPADEAGSPGNTGHLTAGQAGQIAAEVNTGHLVLTHRWVELGMERARSEAAAQFDGPISMAHAGLVIPVGSGR